jgi:FlaA1/EpsC-like NDP-sugar epimerase
MIKLLGSFRNPRIGLALVYDFSVAIITFWFAILLRYEISGIRITELKDIWSFFYINQTVLVFSFVLNGLYRGVWRFSSTHDLVRVIKASLFGIVTSIVVSFFIFRLEGIPRSVYIIQFFVLIVGLGGGRFFYRYIKDQTHLRKLVGGHDIETRRVLVVGAGRAGEKLLRDIFATPSLKLQVVGLIDDDPYKQNALIHNVKVKGKVKEISKIIESNKVDKIFIAVPSATNEQVKEILTRCEGLDCEVKILPKFDQLLSKEVGISLLRNINIEDLLGRDEVELDTDNLQEMIKGKRVLVTGAGGSIGSEICRQVAKYKPAIIILADFCELFMYELEMEFRKDFSETKIIPRIIDVRDEDKINKLFLEVEPEVVFHAAAYKHVPLMEQNPNEAIETNVKGTKNIAQASLTHKVGRFILISTDKAVNPTNVMGASKRIAEMIITNFSNNSEFTKFISVRFGNVLGSNGSVIPHFRKLIDERRDITVTHPEITRYFMSIPEASQLVLQAGAMGDGGEVFVLEMGEPIKIVDLAKEMIKLAKLELNRDINIVYTGLRPGEKLYEELFSEEENFEKTENQKINISKHRVLSENFMINLNDLLSGDKKDKNSLLRLIRRLVPEFDHSELGDVISSDVSVH